MMKIVLQLTVLALLVCSTNCQVANATATDATEIVSLLLQGVGSSDTVMIAKAIADGESIDVTNVNGW